MPPNWYKIDLRVFELESRGIMEQIEWWDGSIPYERGHNYSDEPGFYCHGFFFRVTQSRRRSWRMRPFNGQYYEG